MRRHRSLDPQKRPRARSLIRLSLVAGIGLGAWSLFGVAPAPEAAVRIEPAGIGPASTVIVDASEPRFGLSSIEVVLYQGEEREVVAAESFIPRPLVWPWGDKNPRSHLEFTVGHEKQDWLENGEGRLAVEVARHGGRLRSPAPTTTEITVPVRVTPPRLAVSPDRVVVEQGGAEVVVYTVEENAIRHGVQAGPYWFPGSELPGDERRAFALFSAPWDQESSDGLRLVAEDELGNRRAIAFVDQFVAQPVGTSSIQLSDRFLERVVPPIVAQVSELKDSASPLETYLDINGRLRAENRARLVELGVSSVEEFLWSQPFLPFPGGQVMDAFARRRDYRYDGKTVDQQVHLGYDLASVARAEVPAANAGRVLLAGYLGIYGNVVVLDHGYGLMTLYAHLSGFDVATGDTVERGQTLGRTGTTGLAGGDHLHFATLLRGLPVDPLEWWDEHWIENRLGAKLGGALPFMKANR